MLIVGAGVVVYVVGFIAQQPNKQADEQTD